MKKILIGVPAMDMCSSYFAQSLAMLDRVEDCAISFIIGSLVYDARNKICQAAIAGEFDYIFWLDSDMIFPSNTLEHMFTVCEEENIEKIKRQRTERDKIFPNDMTDKGVISNIYKQFVQLN